MEDDKQFIQKPWVINTEKNKNEMLYSRYKLAFMTSQPRWSASKQIFSANSDQLENAEQPRCNFNFETKKCRYPKNMTLSYTLSNEKQTSEDNILSEIWGLPIIINSRLQHNNHTTTNPISPPLSPSSSSSIDFMKTVPPPGFIPLPVNTPKSAIISENTSFTDIKLQIFKTSKLNENMTSYGMDPFLKIVIDKKELKKDVNYKEIINKLVLFEKYASLSLRPSFHLKNDMLSIFLLNSKNNEKVDPLEHFHPIEKEQLMYMGVSRIQKLMMNERDISSIIFLLRREILSSILKHTKSDVTLLDHQKKFLENRGNELLKKLSANIFVKIHQCKYSKDKLVLFGDPEGTGLALQYIRNLEFSANKAMQPFISQIIYIPRCFHSPMIGIAGARLQAIIKESGHESIRVSFPRFLGSPSWEVIISSNSNEEAAKSAIGKTTDALLASWKSLVTMGIRRRCACTDIENNNDEFNPYLESSTIPTNPGTPDAPGILYLHLPDEFILKESIIIDQNFFNLHPCDYKRISRQTGAFLRRFSTSTGEKLEISGLPKSHLIQIETMIAWINETRMP